jgi:hypothetical protein
MISSRKPSLPKSVINACTKIMVEKFATVSKEKWVTKWCEEVTRYFSKCNERLTFSHETICKKLASKLPMPSVITISAPMPFGANDAYYDERNDKLVFLASGVRVRPKLYEEKRDRAQHFDSYRGSGLPRDDLELSLLIAHMCAQRCLHLSHRCLHFSIPGKLYRIHGGLLQRDLCNLLALEVMLSRVADKQVQREKLYGRVGKAVDYSVYSESEAIMTKLQPSAHGVDQGLEKTIETFRSYLMRQSKWIVNRSAFEFSREHATDRSRRIATRNSLRQ